MGAQITKEVEGGLHGMRCILRAGVMLECVRTMLTSVVQVRTTAGRVAKKPLSFDAWLAKFAPKVSHATAYRFISIAASIQGEFEISMEQLAQAGGFAAFVNTPPEQLPRHLSAKQQELWDFVDGTSQRSWLDRLATPPHSTFDPSRLVGKERDSWAKVDFLANDWDSGKGASLQFTPEDYERWHEDAVIVRERVEAGETPPVKAWGALRGRASTKGEGGRAPTNHFDNIESALTKLKTSLPHWDELSHEKRGELEAFWSDLWEHLLPGSWKATGKQMEGWK